MTKPNPTNPKPEKKKTPSEPEMPIAEVERMLLSIESAVETANALLRAVSLAYELEDIHGESHGLDVIVLLRDVEDRLSAAVARAGDVMHPHRQKRFEALKAAKAAKAEVRP